jgi:hypothetical protein
MSERYAEKNHGSGESHDDAINAHDSHSSISGRAPRCGLFDGRRVDAAFRRAEDFIEKRDEA